MSTAPRVLRRFTRPHFNATDRFTHFCEQPVACLSKHSLGCSALPVAGLETAGTRACQGVRVACGKGSSTRRTHTEPPISGALSSNMAEVKAESSKEGAAEPPVVKAQSSDDGGVSEELETVSAHQPPTLAHSSPEAVARVNPPTLCIVRSRSGRARSATSTKSHR